jgi:hypothetical protein
MSSPVGLYDAFVDTQDVVLDNLTDAKIYTQVKTITPFEINHDMVEHNTCTGYVEKLTSLDGVKLECRAILTETELPALMTLSLVSASKLPVKQWRISFTSFNGLAATITGEAKMFNFKILDRGLDVVMVEFILEFESDISGLDVDVVSVA